MIYFQCAICWAKEHIKRNMKDYPKRGIELFKIFGERMVTIETVPAKYQDGDIFIKVVDIRVIGILY